MPRKGNSEHFTASALLLHPVSSAQWLITAVTNISPLLKKGKRYQNGLILSKPIYREIIVKTGVLLFFKESFIFKRFSPSEQSKQ